MVQDEAEDAGLLAQVKDDNDVMRQPQHRTCLDICLDCYNKRHFSIKFSGGVFLSWIKI